MNSLSALQELGLSEHEASLYLTLLKIGGAQASAIAASAGLKRTSVYALLKSLAQKGFVTMYFRKNKQWYYADKPGRVAHAYQKKLDAFSSLLPALESISRERLGATGLRFIETLPELKKFYEDILEEYKNKEYYIVSSGQEWEALDPGWFIDFRKRRGKNKIRTKLILSPHFKKDNPTNPQLLRQWKFFPEKFKFQSTIDIYRDKILITSPDVSSLAVVIEVPAMVDVFRAMFEMLWATLPTPK